MLGGYISDLEKGDVFRPAEYVLTAFMVREYAHGCEENWEGFHTEDGRIVRPPSMVHVDKMRILEVNTLKETRIKFMREHTPVTSDPRIHYEFHVINHSPAYVGDHIVVTGQITDRYLKRGRDFLDYHLEVHTKDGRHICTYKDKTLLRYRPYEETK